MGCQPPSYQIVGLNLTTTFGHTRVSCWMGMDKRMSSAFHPQTDGQTERANRMLEEMLRAYVSLEHDDWDAKLACAEFAINNSWQATVKNTPFFLNYGQHPLTPATKQLPKAADFA